MFSEVEGIQTWKERTIPLKREDFEHLPQLVIEYTQYLDVVKNKSPLTVLGYASDIRMFFRFLLKSREMVDADVPFNKVDISGLDLEFMKTITLNDAYSFLSYCRSERNNNASTRSRKAVALKRFFRYISLQLKLLEIGRASCRERV